MSEPVDIGHGVTMQWFGWHPDRELNPQYADIPDIEKLTAFLDHPDQKKPGERCACAISLDTPEARKILSPRTLWQVQSLEPLTISPSVLCLRCGFHGFIRDGKWVPA